MGGSGSPRVAHLPGLSVHSPDCPFPMHDSDESMCKHASRMRDPARKAGCAAAGRRATRMASSPAGHDCSRVTQTE